MGKIRTVKNILKNDGINQLFKIIHSRIFYKRIDQFRIIKKLFKNKSGLEIGGPSWIFQEYDLIPIYKLIKNLDGCNFSSTTIWERNLKSGETYNFYKNKTGIQYISEATDLSFISDSKYEFIISSHCLEHIANPIKAIKEWLRVIKNDGHILIVVPNKDKCFDHNRNITSFSHLIEDYNNNTEENDLTHLNEILELNDLNMDLKAGTFEQFKERSLKNLEIRALHHHVFDIFLLSEIFLYFNMQIILTYSEVNHVIIGKKSI